MTALPDPNQKLQTLSIHSGRHVDPATGAVIAPLYTSTTFERDPDGAFSRHYFYSRIDNPNRASLEQCLADLEGGVEAVAFSTGMAASLAVFQALAPRDHVVLHRDLYFGVRELITGLFARWGLEHSFVDMRNVEDVRRACRPQTKLLWLETPTNPLIEVVDIQPVAECARSLQIPLACENTFATPVLQRPLELGADLVVHALTKYLSGHSDALGGAVIFRERSDLATRIKEFQRVGGAVLSPFDCWLILRGLQTLVPRVRLHCENARRVAEFLSTHPAVAVVHYPGLPNDPGHEIASRQMRDFGGMLSFEVRGGRDEAFTLASRVKLIVRATSLGGTHSLIEHRASIEGVFSR
ncbi:MAG TPA: PLP-dependent transferase, partial [Acidobacteriaceae bacterium]|nr:PLP-dependent transferase [Acidobacteriaceae bacterium]